jgi:hypothetical protein
MEFKYYDKSWLPAIKGAFLIIFGIISMSQILGSIRSLASLFIVLIGMIGIILIAGGIMFKTSKFRAWGIVSGLINIIFCLVLALKIEAPREVISMILLFWIIFQAITEIIEAGILIYLKNAFSALFILNALLTGLFGYFLSIEVTTFTSQGLFYLGVVALTFGLANELSAYLLSRIKK